MKGAPTELNLWVLGQHFGSADTAPNAIEPTSATHLRRCMKAGLFVVTPNRTLALTDAGRVALASLPRR